MKGMKRILALVLSLFMVLEAVPVYAAKDGKNYYQVTRLYHWYKNNGNFQEEHNFDENGVCACGLTEEEADALVDCTFHYTKNLSSGKLTSARHSFGELGIGTCINCGITYLESTKLHKYGNARDNHDNTTHKISCTVSGCDDYHTEVHNIKTTKVEATCTQNGYEIFECTKCSYSDTDYYPKKEHTYVASLKTNDPNDHYVTCSGCGRKTTQRHNYEIINTAIPATCTTNGWGTYRCKDCGYEYTGTIYNLGHDYHWVYKDRQNHEYKCSRCGDVDYTAKHKGQSRNSTTCKDCGCSIQITKTYPSTTWEHMHEYVPVEIEDDDVYHDRKCLDVCNSTFSKEEHTYGEPVITSATCTKNGSKKWTCTGCGHVKEVPILAHHDYEEIGRVEATCTTDGHEAGRRCKSCNHEEGLQVIRAHHDLVDVTRVEATCTEPGHEAGHRCTKCTYTDGLDPIPALRHDFENGTEVETVPSTCSVPGHVTVKCSRCNETETTPLPLDKNNHKEIEVKGYNSTCHSTGLTDGTKCEWCSEWIIPQTEIGLKNHNLVEDTTITSTFESKDNDKHIRKYTLRCTNEGCTHTEEESEELDHNFSELEKSRHLVNDEEQNNHYETWKEKCSDCNKEVDRTNAPENHTWDNGVITTIATCITDGIKKFTCACGAWYEENFGKDSSNHVNIIPDDAVPATCLTSGLTEGSHCEDCNATIVKQEVVDALGHEESNWYVPKKATNNEDGYKAKDCLRENCKQKEIEKETINKANLSVENDEVIYNGKAQSITAPEFEEIEINTVITKDGEVVNEAVNAGVYTFTFNYLGNDEYEAFTLTAVLTITKKAVPASWFDALVESLNISKDFDDNNLVYFENGTVKEGTIENDELEGIEVPYSMAGIYDSKMPGDEKEVTLTINVDNENFELKNAKVKTAGSINVKVFEDETFETVVLPVKVLNQKEEIEEAIENKIGDRKNQFGNLNVTNSSVRKDITFDEYTECEKIDSAKATYELVLRGNVVARRSFNGTIQRVHSTVTDAEVKATCTASGLTEGSHCENCQTVFVKQEVIDALEHNWDNGVVTTEPTCTEKGVRTFTCSSCQGTYTENIDPAGHTEVIDPRVEPTCHSIGLTEGKHCSTCSAVLVSQETIEMTEHNFVRVDGSDDCVQIEGNYENHKHVWTEKCTNEGCTETKPGEELLVHDFENGRVDATCTTKGYDYRTCKDCGYYYERNKNDYPARGHDFTSENAKELERKNPTCEKDGYKIMKCSRCEEQEKITLEKTGHKWVKTVNSDSYEETGNTHTHICYLHCENGCGTKIKQTTTNESHTYGEWTVTKEATCTETGLKERTCICGHANTEVIPVDTTAHDSEHAYWMVSERAGNDTDGKELYICGRENCNTPLDEKIIWARNLSADNKTVTYDGEDKSTEIEPNGDDYTLVITKDGKEVKEAVNAGVYTLTFTFAENEKYNEIKVSATLTINPVKINLDDVKYAEELQALRDKNIDRDYNGTNKVLFDGKEEMNITLDGANVKVTGTFENKLPGEKKPALLELSIEDENGNYVFANNETKMQLRKEGSINVIKLTDTFGDVNLDNNVTDKKEISKAIDKNLDKSDRDIKDFKFEDAKIADYEYDIPDLNTYGTKEPATVTIKATVKDEEGNDVVIIEKKVTGTITYNYSSGKKKKKNNNKNDEIEIKDPNGVALGLDFEFIDLPKSLETPSDWAKDDIYDLTYTGIVNGYEDQTYRPNSNIRRDEFAKLAYLILGLKEDPNGNAKEFEDTVNNWAKDMIKEATTVNVLSGYDDRFFGPADNITNEQMMAILVRGLKYLGADVRITDDAEADKELAKVIDGAEVSDWAKLDAATAIKYGLFQGDENKAIKPLGHTTRAQVAVIIKRYQKVIADLVK